MRHVQTCFVFATALVLAGAGRAQTPTGAVEGTVTDPSGAVVSNAAIRAVETGSNRSISSSTNGRGRYSLRNLLPGVYDIRAGAPGFAVTEVSSVKVDAGAVAAVDVSLVLGTTEQVIQVTSADAPIDRSRATVDTIISEEQIRKMPLLGRNALELALLAPGTSLLNAAALDPTKTASLAVGVNGRAGAGTRVQIDGIDVTDETVGTTVANMSADAVSEFQLTRSSLDISTPLTSSGAINIITRSGGNDIHGNWFWDFQNQEMSARLGYNPAEEPFRRHRTGGIASGPLVRNKLFWLANWERHYQTARKIFIAPEFPQLNRSVGFPVGVRYGSGRLDWNLGSGARLFYRFSHYWDVTTGGTVPSPFHTVNWTNTQAVGMDFNRARSTHSFRLGYVNFNNRISSEPLGAAFPAAPNGVPYLLTVGSYRAGPHPLAPQQTYQDNYQASYEGTRFHGRHNFRFGASATRIVTGGFANFAGPLAITGRFDRATIDGLARRGADVRDPLEYPLLRFTTGPQNGFFSVRPAHGFPYGGVFNTRLAWFLGDSIRATRRLTLNLGVRWGYDTGYFGDMGIPRDPVLDRWIPGAAKHPRFPRDLFSPSLGFAYALTGRTVIRGGFYKAYEMSLDNAAADTMAMLPAGIGPDAYEISRVAGPDGRPINVDGRHPNGNYEDLIGRPMKDVIGLIADVHAALNSAYANHEFDPNRGPSLFTQTGGAHNGALLPGSQSRVPYSIQLNLGVQRELSRGTVLTADYVHNHAVGLPHLSVDYERRRDAATLDIAAARARIGAVLGGRSVDEWIAANPSRDISAFALVNDAIWPGLHRDYTLANFTTGGYTTYKGLQVSLRGRRATRRFRAMDYIVAYALSRNRSIQVANNSPSVERRAQVIDNREWNDRRSYGPNALDATHNLTAAGSVAMPGGFRLNTLVRFRTAPPISVFMPNFGGAVAGVNGFFGTDLNGDGSRGTAPRPDLLPGLGVGQFGRNVKSFDDLNRIIVRFNETHAGQLTPHGQALVAGGLFTEAQLKKFGAVIPGIPLVPANNPYPFHNLLVSHIRVDRAIRLGAIREGMQLLPFVDIFNLFNHAPADVYGGLAGRFGQLNFDYSAAGPGQQAGDLASVRQRITATRRLQVGVRFEF